MHETISQISHSCPVKVIRLFDLRISSGTYKKIFIPQQCQAKLLEGRITTAIETKMPQKVIQV